MLGAETLHESSRNLEINFRGEMSFVIIQTSRSKMNDAIELPDDSAAARKTARNISFALFVAGGVVGLYQMATTVIPFGDGFEMVELAKNLAHSGNYANPFRVLE